MAAKKSPPKKAALLTASLRLRLRATCGARARGVRRNSLRACALRSNSRRKSVYEVRLSCGSRTTPRPVLLGAFRRVGAEDSFSMILIATHAYGICVKHHFHQNRPAQAGRWTSSPSLLSTPDAHSVRRIRARVCLSAASLRETPLNASTTGRLERSGGTGIAGRTSLPTFLLRNKKVGRPPGRTPGQRRQPQSRCKH